MKYLKHFGGRIKAEHREKYRHSPHWVKGRFRNLHPISFKVKTRHILKFLFERLFHDPKYSPPGPIPVFEPQKETILEDNGKLKFVWFGHSNLLLRMDALTIMIDPMFGYNASPIAPIRTMRYSENILGHIDNLPDPDLVLISHDHYDHLDLESIERLKDRTGHFVVALGVARHLESWGISSDRITEVDWWQAFHYKGLEITLTPTQHFSGRLLKERAQSFWGGWAIRGKNENIWFSGDGGYNDHFKEIGRRLGPFDLGFMECGQYNENWKVLHMFPEESVQAALDAGVKKAIPVHWASFTLAMHHWLDPIRRFMREADRRGLEVIHPELGVVCDAESGCGPWWETIDN